MSAKKSLIRRIIAVIFAVAGVVMIVAGAFAWNMASTELASQKINVADEGKKENIANGPFDALSQIDLIKEHTDAAIVEMGFPEGTVYSEVPMPDQAELNACKADATSSPNCAQDLKNDGARTFFDNSNFKQASLYTSVIAFGVSALVVGVGLLFLLLGMLEFVKTTGRQRTTSV